MLVELWSGAVGLARMPHSANLSDNDTSEGLSDGDTAFSEEESSLHRGQERAAGTGLLDGDENALASLRQENERLREALAAYPVKYHSCLCYIRFVCWSDIPSVAIATMSGGRSLMLLQPCAPQWTEEHV